jgi:hypothetical protein
MADSIVEFKDRTIVCRECRCTFTWSASEQCMYASFSLRAPKMCLKCRMWWRLPRAAREGSRPGGDKPQRAELEAALEAAFPVLFFTGDPRADQVLAALTSRRFASLRAAYAALSASVATAGSEATATT